MDDNLLAEKAVTKMHAGRNARFLLFPLLALLLIVMTCVIGVLTGYILKQLQDASNQNNQVKQDDNSANIISPRPAPVPEAPAPKPIVKPDPVPAVPLIDPSAIWFNGKKYPQEVLDLVKSETYITKCTKDFSFSNGSFVDMDGNTADSETLATINKIVQSHSNIGLTKERVRISRCVAESNGPIMYIYDYCMTSCGGGMGTVSGVIMREVSSEFDNTTGPYVSCHNLLALTKDNIVYLNCGAGDGGYGAMEIYKIDMNNLTSKSVAKEESISSLP